MTRSPPLVCATPRAIQLDSTLADAYIAQGYGRIAQWDWARSEASFRRALMLEPLNPDAHHWYADLLFARGDLTGALNEQQRAEQLDPTSAIVVAEIANVLYSEHRYAEAIVTGRRATEMDPALTATYLNYAAAFLMTERPDSALALVTNGLRAGGQGQILQAYALRAAAYAAVGRSHEAQQDVARIEAAVGHGDAAYTAALARIGIGDREGALRWLTRSIEARESEDATNAVSCDPMFDQLKRDARFMMLMRRMDVHVCPAA